MHLFIDKRWAVGWGNIFCKLRGDEVFVVVKVWSLFFMLHIHFPFLYYILIFGIMPTTIGTNNNTINSTKIGTVFAFFCQSFYYLQVFVTLYSSFSSILLFPDTAKSTVQTVLSFYQQLLNLECYVSGAHMFEF